MTEDVTTRAETTRRTVLKRAGVAGAVTVWTLPVVQTLTATAAHAVGSPPPGTQTGTVTGRVVDAATGSAIAGASVSVDGTALTAVTGADGSYVIPAVPSGARTVRASATGYVTQTQNVTVPPSGSVTANFALASTDVGVRVVLQWATAPEDLDLHLSGPDGSGGRFHAYWASGTGGTDFVSLDRDDVDGEGPETMTVTISASDGGDYVAGEYRAWVHNYSQVPEWDVSAARVTLNGTTSQVAQYDVSAASGDVTQDIWRVVNFTVNDAGQITSVSPVQQIVPGSSGSVF